MKSKLLAAAAALAVASALAPSTAVAQPLPAPSIAVVNVEQIATTCTPCAAANTQLTAQATQLQQRANALAAQIQTEATALQALINAVPAGQQPDAALATRIQTFQTTQQNAEREIAAGRERLQRNAAFVNQQVGQRIRPAIDQVVAQRGATLAIDRGSVLAASPTLDITAAVLAIVNRNTAAINVNAPAPTPTPPTTPARPATPPPTTPRPSGR